MAELTGVTVKLTELVGPNDLIENYTFTDCRIVGPAVVVPLGNGAFQSSRFMGDLDALMWEIPANRERVLGAIGLVDCAFERCVFERIGIAGPPEFIADFRRGLAAGSAPGIATGPMTNMAGGAFSAR